VTVGGLHRYQPYFCPILSGLSFQPLEVSMTARCGRGHPRTWTAEEDVILLNSVRGTERKCWKQIALKFKDRTGKQCRQRYKYHLEQELKTGDWTPEEDEIIIQMQAKIGNCWSKISKALPGRSDNAVKNRWHCTLYRSEKKKTSIFQMNINKSSLIQCWWRR